MTIRPPLPSVLCFALVLAVGRWGYCDAVSFRKDLAPILLQKCMACHGPDDAEGSYRVDSFQRVMAPGDSGLTPFTAADLDDSEAFRRLVSEDESERMPMESDPLSQKQVDLFRRWIDQGAVFDGSSPTARLASILPPVVHPDAPEVYPATLPVAALAFTPDGRHLVVGGYHELTYWSPDDGRLIQRTGNVGQRVFSLDFSPDGQLLAIACGAPGQLGEVRMIGPTNGEPVQTLLTSSGVVLDVGFSPDGNRLAACGADGAIWLCEVDARTEVQAITSHSDWVTAVAWNGDGTRLASSSRDKSAKAFNAATGELLITYSGHGEVVSGVAFHPNGQQVYSAGADRKIHLWNVADGKKTSELGGFGGDVFNLMGTGTVLLAASADKTAREFDVNSGKHVRTYTGHTDWVLSLAYHQDTGRLATGGFDGSVRIWSTKDGKQRADFVAAPGYTPPGPSN